MERPPKSGIIEGGEKYAAVVVVHVATASEVVRRCAIIVDIAVRII
eukprot:CAMPEP_0171445028 /NCGR_PEP_ID=MMETSP0881-20121228/34906_1 /TAXON_ID=67004 /ORGANISM="Thalassiosira weissflogii, Strain CCMP1336" /LENGTH=45 /DNA_ID= /DNA_START= /DNA_END= /DNA_ORIENTATION=